MNNIPTAEEFCKSYETKGKTWQDNFHETMIEFAKLHVKAALKEAVNNIEYYTDPFDENNEKYVEEKSILNAYPYEKIR